MSEPGICTIGVTILGRAAHIPMLEREGWRLAKNWLRLWPTLYFSRVKLRR
jgi:hypothetical protein